MADDPRFRVDPGGAPPEEISPREEPLLHAKELDKSVPPQLFERPVVRGNPKSSIYAFPRDPEDPTKPAKGSWVSIVVVGGHLVAFGVWIALLLLGRC